MENEQNATDEKLFNALNYEEKKAHIQQHPKARAAALIMGGIACVHYFPANFRGQDALALRSARAASSCALNSTIYTYYSYALFSGDWKVYKNDFSKLTEKSFYHALYFMFSLYGAMAYAGQRINTSENALIDNGANLDLAYGLALLGYLREGILTCGFFLSGNQKIIKSLMPMCKNTRKNSEGNSKHEKSNCGPHLLTKVLAAMISIAYSFLSFASIRVGSCALFHRWPGLMTGLSPISWTINQGFMPFQLYVAFGTTINCFINCKYGVQEIFKGALIACNTAKKSLNSGNQLSDTSNPSSGKQNNGYPVITLILIMALSFLSSGAAIYQATDSSAPADTRCTIKPGDTWDQYVQNIVETYPDIVAYISAALAITYNIAACTFINPVKDIIMHTLPNCGSKGNVVTTEPEKTESSNGQDNKQPSSLWSCLPCQKYKTKNTGLALEHGNEKNEVVSV